MEFINETDYQADAIWGSHLESLLGVAIIAKKTFKMDQGQMVSVNKDPWPIHFRELDTPYGKFPSEYHPFGKPRTDMIICGCARPPKGKSVSAMEIVATVGSFNYSFPVFGDRHWEKRNGRLVPSQPLPFTKVPLTLEYAYGGMVEQEWGELKYIHNPVGKGFYLTEDQALNRPLPNLEHRDCLIKDIMDRPIPFAPCIYPMDGGLRLEPLKKAMEPDYKPIHDAHLQYCWGHPELMVDEALNVGDPVSVKGILEEGIFSVVVPPFEADGFVHCGTKKKMVEFKCDTIIVQGEEKRITFRWRGALTIELSPREKRMVQLVNKGRGG